MHPCNVVSFTRELIVIGIGALILQEANAGMRRPGARLIHYITASALAVGTSMCMVGRYNPQHTASKDEPTSYMAIE